MEEEKKNLVPQSCVLSEALIKLRDTEEKTTLVKESCVLLTTFGTSKSNSKVSKSNSWKITYYTKTTLLQRELFLTMFFLKAVMLKIILSNYH